MTNIDKNLLELLLLTPSVSGYELNIQKKLVNHLKNVVDDFILQENMNVIHVLNKNSKVKMLFLTHIDELGLIIERINDDGSLKCASCGSIRPYMYAGQHVQIVKDDKIIEGVISYVPNMDKGITVKDLYIDLGTKSKEESENLVEIGDSVVVKPYINYLNGERLASRALDDKIAVYIMTKVIENVKGKTTNGVYFSSTVGEETTSRGAKTAVKHVKPTCVISLDVCYASDAAYISNKNNKICLGNGPVLTVGSVMNQKMHQMFKDICKKHEIPYQLSVEPERTYTDSDHTYMYAPTYLISIPLRYMHSSVEMCDLNDINQIIKLVSQFIIDFDENTNLNPFLD